MRRGFTTVFAHTTPIKYREEGKARSTLRDKGLCSAVNKQGSTDRYRGFKEMKQKNLAAKPRGVEERVKREFFPGRRYHLFT
jgi:hypothetical protein